MAMNEIFAPNGPRNKMSVKAGGSDTKIDPGTPLKVGGFVGVAQTGLESEDGGYSGIVNSNAPGNVTMWNGFVSRLSVDVGAEGVKFGDVVYAVTDSDSIVVGLEAGNVAPTTGSFPFGLAREDAATGTVDLAVEVFEYSGAEVASQS